MLEMRRAIQIQIGCAEAPRVKSLTAKAEVRCLFLQGGKGYVGL